MTRRKGNLTGLAALSRILRPSSITDWEQSGHRCTNQYWSGGVAAYHCQSLTGSSNTQTSRDQHMPGTTGSSFLTWLTGLCTAMGSVKQTMTLAAPACCMLQESCCMLAAVTWHAAPTVPSTYTQLVSPACAPHWPGCAYPPRAQPQQRGPHRSGRTPRPAAGGEKSKSASHLIKTLPATTSRLAQELPVPAVAVTDSKCCRDCDGYPCGDCILRSPQPAGWSCYLTHHAHAGSVHDGYE
jgi:hypothetical protein